MRRMQTGLSRIGMLVLCAIMVALLRLFGNPAYAQEYMQIRPTKIADNMEPAIPHPEQETQVKKKLADLQKRFGRKPNVLIILLDDVGWGDPGCYGGGIAVGAPTPNIDRMAREGLLLTSCYAQPTCSPTRATLMTGQLPIHHGLLRPPMFGEKGGLENAVTAASRLDDAGYTTAIVGKWHCGESEPSQPQNVGYDEFYGFLSVCNMYTEWRDPYYNPEIVYSPARTRMIEEQPFSKHLVKAERGEKLQNVKEITIPVLAQIDQDFLHYSQDFIRRMNASAKPFYLIHATSKCHFDNYPAKGYDGRSPAKQKYKDALVECDDIVGELLTTLEETGQLENTFVFFTSDNGPEEEIIRDYGYTPFRSGKGSTWEGGVRVPGIAYWPGIIKPGRQSDGLFDLADLFTTSIVLGGGKPPTDRYIYGIDQCPFLFADEGESNRRSVIYYLLHDLSAVRIDEYKMYRLATELTTDMHAQVGGLSGSTQLYSYGKMFNLYLDPKEERTLMIRKTWVMPAMQEEMNRFKEVLKKYPPAKTFVGMQ